MDLFREQARKYPENIAVVFDDRKLTYRELDEITDKLAKRLCALGVQREKAVGVLIERSEYMVIYPLAIMKAGGAYLPLDYTNPSDRLAFMIRDSGAGLILSEGSRVAESLPGFEGIVINKEDLDSPGIEDDIALPHPVPEICLFFFTLPGPPVSRKVACSNTGILSISADGMPRNSASLPVTKVWLMQTSLSMHI